MMKVKDFLSMLMKAKNCKTLYVMGGWGFPLNAENKKRTQSQPYNQQSARKVKINAASSDTFAFDCCGLPRAVLWGWNGDASKKNGGAVFGSNGVPELDAKQFMFQGCTEQSNNFKNIEAGEFLWLDGHCGVYLGDGLAIESTPKWKDGVQITAVANIGKKAGYESRTWTYHGHLKYVEYEPSKYPDVPFDIKVLKSGVTGLRATGYSDGKYLGTVKAGTYTVTELNNDFGFIGKGWVYLIDKNIVIGGAEKYVAGKDYTVNVDGLNMRASASTKGDALAEMNKGAKVTCRDVKTDANGNTWLKVDGWIAAEYGGDVYVE